MGAIRWRIGLNVSGACARGYLLCSCFSSTASWYWRRISAKSTDGFGNLMSSASIESAIICDTARLRNHLWLDGMYHGASRVLVALIASSNASI